MQRFVDAIATFEHAIDRSKQMVSLYDALEALRPNNYANDDALRSAYILAVSSFDFFAHELAAIEADHRLGEKQRTRKISLPMELLTVEDTDARRAAAVIKIRQGNSYKAFVDPGKLAEMLSCYCETPWQKIRDKVNEALPPDNHKNEDSIKAQLKLIWKRRNQIAHEADVNPALAGISLWPIDKSDTLMTIDFIYSLGVTIPHVISIALTDEAED